MKTHYTPGGGTTACGHKGRVSGNVFAVDCRLCARKLVFIEAQAKAAAEKMERFLAQEPVAVKEPWKDGHMTCKECGHDKFRHADRTCYGHYDNWTCAKCGANESRLTETGMSF